MTKTQDFTGIGELAAHANIVARFKASGAFAVQFAAAKTVAPAAVFADAPIARHSVSQLL